MLGGCLVGKVMGPAVAISERLADVGVMAGSAVAISVQGLVDDDAGVSRSSLTSAPGSKASRPSRAVRPSSRLVCSR